MSDLEKMIKVNSLLILIANYNSDKRIETNRFFRASVYSLLSSLGLLFSGEGTYKLHAEIYRLHVEVSRILSKDSSYELISEIGFVANLGVFMASIGNFVEEISTVEDNGTLAIYSHTYSELKMQMDYLKTRD